MYRHLYHGNNSMILAPSLSHPSNLSLTNHAGHLSVYTQMHSLPFSPPALCYRELHFQASLTASFWKGTANERTWQDIEGQEKGKVLPLSTWGLISAAIVLLLWHQLPLESPVLNGPSKPSSVPASPGFLGFLPLSLQP